VCYNKPCVLAELHVYFVLMPAEEGGNDMDMIRMIENEQLRNSIPDFNIGDTVRVLVKVVEGSREKLQAFEGIVIQRQNGGLRETFTVRKISYGVGIERTFPLHSPRVDSINVVRKGKVRRAKLFYLRERLGKAARVKILDEKK